MLRVADFYTAPVAGFCSAVDNRAICRWGCRVGHGRRLRGELGSSGPVGDPIFEIDIVFGYAEPRGPAPTSLCDGQCRQSRKAELIRSQSIDRVTD